jgi:hypothetical protein
MAHEIIADNNTCVGYDYITKEYYVKNLDTKIVVTSVADAMNVLDITAPGRTVTITEEDIEKLSTSLEPITKIYYTLEDTGRYIKNIYFNDYKKYAIQYDEPYLYIKESNEMWNMSSTIGTDSVSLFLWQFYLYHLGLDVTKRLIDTIVAYYKSIQQPYVYNIIEPLTKEDKEAEKPLMYSNKFILNNANKESRGEYSGTKNPNNVNTLESYDVIATSSSDNTITCIGKNINCAIGDIIQVTGTVHFYNLFVKGVIEEENEGVYYTKIYVEENTGSAITNNNNLTDTKVWINAYLLYSAGYEEQEEIKSSQQISDINSKNVYLLNLLLENQYVEGETVYINYGDNIIEQNKIDTNGVHISTFTNNNPVRYNQGYLTMKNTPSSSDKLPYVLGNDPVFLEKRDYTKFSENSFSILMNFAMRPFADAGINFSTNLGVGDTFYIFNTNSSLNGEYTVSDIKFVGNIMKLYVNRESDNPLPEFTSPENKGIMQLRKKSHQIQLNMSFSKRADKMPTGEFLLDNDQQFTEYLTYYKIIPPNAQNYNNFNQPVPLDYYLGDNLLFSTENIKGHIVVRDVEELKSCQGDEGENKYAYVITSSDTTAIITRYKYIGISGNEYVWDIEPEHVSMELAGLYSDVYPQKTN